MPFSLTRCGWSFVLAAGGFGVAGLFIRLRDFWYLPALLIAVPVVAILTVLLLRATARLEVHLTASDPTPSVGSTVALSAIITHRLPIALDARVNWVLGGATASADVMLPRGTSQRAPSPRAPSRQIVQQWIAMLRGPASVGIRTVWIRDPLGVATARLTCDKGALLLLTRETPLRARTPGALVEYLAGLGGLGAYGGLGSEGAEALRMLAGWMEAERFSSEALAYENISHENISHENRDIEGCVTTVHRELTAQVSRRRRAAALLMPRSVLYRKPM